MAKTVKRTVVHPKLYLRVDGKLQHVKKGTEVTITKEQCENLGAKLADPAKQKKLDTTAEGGQASEGAAPESEVVKQLTTELKEAKSDAKKAQMALQKVATDLDAATKEIAVLEKAAKK